MSKIAVVSCIIISIWCSGCIGCSEYAEREVCVEYGYVDMDCLAKMTIHVPPNYSESELDLIVYEHDMCGHVPYELLIIEDPEIDEIHINHLFDKKAQSKTCTKTEKRYICIR